MEKIFFLNPRGPCAGVKRALSIVENALQKYGTPIFVNHQIVHNEFIVQKFEQKGVVFCKKPEEVPEGSIYIFSAHGVPPQLKKQAKARNLQIIDATCPLVNKVHKEAREFTKKNVHILYIGHKNHPEALGVMGISQITLIDSIETAKNIILPDSIKNKITVLTQTTLSIDETSEIISVLQKRFPQIIIPKIKDICYATQNRQNAVKKIVKKIDTLLVIGSTKSSNSNRLVETALKNGREAYLVPNKKKMLEIIKIFKNDEKKRKILGITSGASVPEELTQKIFTTLTKHYPNIQTEEISGIQEEIQFTLPYL